MTETPKISLMLVEDHALLREGLRVLVEAEGDIQVVAEVERGQEAVEKAIELKPRVVLMDIALVGLDGIEATRRIVEAAPDVSVLVLSASAELYVARAALEAGAIGYLLKRARGEELRAGVREAAAGKAYFSDDVLREVRERMKVNGPGKRRARPGPPGSGRGSDPENPKTFDQPQSVLTDRELEVLQMIAVGHSNKEIAEILKLSVKTIETHRMHLMEKLDIHDVSGLTRYALRKGLIEC